MKEGNESISVDDIIVGKWKNIKADHADFPNIESLGDTYFKSELTHLRKSIRDRSSEMNTEFIERYEYEYKLVELFLLENLYLFITFEKHFGLNPKSFKISQKDSSSFQVLRTTTLLLHQLSNNLTGFLKLISDGLSFQANALFRSTIEVGSIITAILLDAKFHSEYKNHPLIENSDEKKKHWYKFLRPKEIDKVIEKGYEKAGRSGENWRTILSIRESLYSETSGYVHSQFLTSVSSSYSEEFEGDDSLDLNLLGRIDSNTKYTLDKFLVYLKLLFHDIKHFIVTHHDIKFNKFEEDGLSIVFTSKLNEVIFNALYREKSI